MRLNVYERTILGMTLLNPSQPLKGTNLRLLFDRLASQNFRLKIYYH